MAPLLRCFYGNGLLRLTPAPELLTIHDVEKVLD